MTLTRIPAVDLALAPVSASASASALALALSLAARFVPVLASRSLFAVYRQNVVRVARSVGTLVIL